MNFPAESKILDLVNLCHVQRENGKFDIVNFFLWQYIVHIVI